MKTYSAWLSNGEEREYTARSNDTAITKGIKLAKHEGELLAKIYDVTDIETSEECPVVWER